MINTQFHCCPFCGNPRSRGACFDWQSGCDVFFRGPGAGRLWLRRTPGDRTQCPFCGALPRVEFAPYPRLGPLRPGAPAPPVIQWAVCPGCGACVPGWRPTADYWTPVDAVEKWRVRQTPTQWIDRRPVPDSGRLAREFRNAGARRRRETILWRARQTPAEIDALRRALRRIRFGTVAEIPTDGPVDIETRLLS